MKRIYCDFDNTITCFDVTDALLKNFASPAWEDLERQWQEGSITAHECMERQVELFQMDRTSLDAFLDTVPTVAGFKEFAEYCTANGISLSVISDGLDYSIYRVLSKLGVSVPVITNHLVFKEDGGFRLEFPYKQDGCPSGVCKCAAAGSEGDFMLIGDGRSDVCLSGKAGFVLARKGFYLEKHCMEKRLPYDTFDDFFDVMDICKKRLS